MQNYIRAETLGKATSFNFTEVNRYQKQGLSWSYADLDQRQREIAHEIRAGKTPGRILLSEVAPVITLGRKAQKSDLLYPAATYLGKGMSLYPTDRGGLLTYHGPGQWVLFIVMKLQDLTGDSRGVKKAVQTLLQIAQEAVQEFVPRSMIRLDERTGLWTPEGGKLASVGVHIEDGILLHGLCVNGFSTPLSFFGIHPCGLNAAPAYVFSEPSEELFLHLGNRLLDTALKMSRINAIRLSSIASDLGS